MTIGQSFFLMILVCFFAGALISGLGPSVGVEPPYTLFVSFGVGALIGTFWKHPKKNEYNYPN